MANLNESSAVAPLTMTGKKWTVRAIAGDVQGSSAYYPATVLEADAEKFVARKKIYLDHPTKDDKFNRPERSARDVIGYIENGKFDGKDIISEATIFSDWQEWVKERAEAGVIGMSIRASGDVEESGTLKSFTELHSVDLVTDPGAGGGLLNMTESKSIETPELKESEMDEATKKLIEGLAAGLGELKDAVGFLAEAEKARVLAAEKAVEEANKPKVLSPTEIAGKLVEAKLTESAQARVLKSVEAGADLAEAIKTEQDIAKEVLEAAKESGADFKGHAQDDKPLTEAERTAALGDTIFG